MATHHEAEDTAHLREATVLQEVDTAHPEEDSRREVVVDTDRHRQDSIAEAEEATVRLRQA